jgi:hypothetical protein
LFSYETLDAIADTYIPILALVSFVSLGKTIISSQWRLLTIHSALLVAGILLAYGLMLLDIFAGIWPVLGLDYSTHTAVALVLVCYLAVVFRKYFAIWIGSSIAYFLLMLYQGYHTVADIGTTILAVSLLFYPIVFLCIRENNRAER